MTKIKISELFWSVQGEGQYIGVPSIFLRTFGCNFTCSGFGLPKGELSSEPDKIAKTIDKDITYENLPLVSIGCDSYASWHPAFKNLSPMMTIEQIVNRMKELLPNGKFSRDKHLIITGGEPLLGWQRTYPDLINAIIENGMELTHLTFETNGTQPLTRDFSEYLYRQATGSGLEVTFSISAKLPCSGESFEDAIRPDIVKDYLRVPNNRSYFKFVVATTEDVKDAKHATELYTAAGIDIPVYLMPVGGVNSVYELNERAVADYSRDNGFRFSPRIQVPLYKNAWGT